MTEQDLRVAELEAALKDVGCVVAGAPRSSLGDQLVHLVWIGRAAKFFTVLADKAAEDAYALLRRTVARAYPDKSAPEQSEVRLLDPATMNTWILTAGLRAEVVTAALEAARGDKRGSYMTFDPETGAWG